MTTTVPGRHADGCHEDCRGCLRALASDGLRLCRHHRDNIGRDAILAATLYTELALRLSGTTSPGEKTSGSRDPNLNLNERAAEARTTIRHTLVSWCRLVADERGLHLPADTITTIAGYIAHHADWLSAHPAAGECSAELHELAHGQPWRAAYPTGARVVTIGMCPEPTDDGPCHGVVRAILRRTDALLPSELVCDHDDQHRWSADQWRQFARTIQPDGMFQRSYTAAEIAREHRIPPGTVYWLASQHQWRRTTDGHKPVLYDAADVEATLRNRAAA